MSRGRLGNQIFHIGSLELTLPRNQRSRISACGNSRALSRRGLDGAANSPDLDAFSLFHQLGNTTVSHGFQRKIADNVPKNLIPTALSETNYRTTTGQIKKSAGAFFTAEINRLTEKSAVHLNLRDTR